MNKLCVPLIKTYNMYPCVCICTREIDKYKEYGHRSKYTVQRYITRSNKRKLQNVCIYFDALYLACSLFFSFFVCFVLKANQIANTRCVFRTLCIILQLVRDIARENKLIGTLIKNMTNSFW